MPWKDPERQRIHSREYRRKRWAEGRPGDREYQREANRKKRARLSRFLSSVKLTVGCERCGYREHPAALDYHHISPRRGDKSQHMRWTASWRAVVEKVFLTEVLCKNCHGIETWGKAA